MGQPKYKIKKILKGKGEGVEIRKMATVALLFRDTNIWKSNGRVNKFIE